MYYYYYVTDTAGFSDIKIHIKHGYTSRIHMGRLPGSLQKALSPHHYAETLDAPIRTMMLLRAWGIQRARRLGWAQETDARIRQDEVDVFNLMREIREFGAPLEKPLLGDVASHAKLVEYVPQVVRALLAEPP